MVVMVVMVAGNDPETVRSKTRPKHDSIISIPQQFEDP